MARPENHAHGLPINIRLGRATILKLPPFAPGSEPEEIIIGTELDRGEVRLRIVAPPGTRVLQRATKQLTATPSPA